MNNSDWSVQDADQYYGISKWGNGHFGVNQKAS